MAYRRCSADSVDRLGNGVLHQGHRNRKRCTDRGGHVPSTSTVTARPEDEYVGERRSSQDEQRKVRRVEHRTDRGECLRGTRPRTGPTPHPRSTRAPRPMQQRHAFEQSTGSSETVRAAGSRQRSRRTQRVLTERSRTVPSVDLRRPCRDGANNCCEVGHDLIDVSREGLWRMRIGAVCYSAQFQERNL